MAKRRMRKYAFTPGAAGVGTITIPGKWDLEDLLIITNVTDNIIIYNFALPAYAGTTAVYTEDSLAAFPNLLQNEAGYTTITLVVDTSLMSASDDIQIFLEDVDNGLKIRPWDFGTDAIERMRVSTPQSLIDADFEYGLQPTKWAGYGSVRGYPSAYELPGIDLTVANIASDFTTTSPNNSLINVVFTTAHGILPGEVVNVSGLNKGVVGYSRSDGNFIVFSTPSTDRVTYFARGLVGVAANQSLFTDDTLVKRGALYTGANMAVTAVTSDGTNPSNITVFFANSHGLIPGTPIHANIGTGTNAFLATGPFIVANTPSKNSFVYRARAGGAVATPGSVNVYAFSNATILHRPQDGGVILETKTPSYGAAVVRQSKKYFRYQSGKGLIWSTGTLLKPNYDIQTITASGTSIGSTITVTTDDIDHGLQAGANVRITGVTTLGYNDFYTVNSIIDDYSFTVLAKSVLGATPAVLDLESRVFVNSWQGASVRAGMFDDQNGLFWEFNGNTLYVVRRTSTFQMTGTLSVTASSNLIRGTDTRFRKQTKVGDRIVIRGMTHFVADVESDTVMHITPDYRGTTATGVKANLVRETRIPQSEFNLDKIDGTGPSGFNVDLSRMQMLGMQYSWYGAGFVDFMIRGPDGNWVFAHRIKNNNVNSEAYMRSGNLPVRYSIENDTPSAALSANMTNSQTTIPLDELKFFTDTGTVMIDNELMSYTGRSATSGAGNLTGVTRGTTLTQYQQGTNATYRAGAATTHDQGTGVILVSNLCSPTLTHWGSALIMDGGYDQERGYIFNYQNTSIALTTTTRSAFAIRLAPSVENSQVGALGAKDLLNRSQLLLQACAISTGAPATNPGAVVIEGILNPKNFATGNWSALNTEAVGGQPSLAQIATSFTWTTGTFALPGEQIFAFTAPTTASGSVDAFLELDKLKELTGAPLGGDFKYPDGSDVLVINVRVTSGSATGHLLLRWAEAQA